jgi:hypothetical protein
MSGHDDNDIQVTKMTSNVEEITLNLLYNTTRKFMLKNKINKSMQTMQLASLQKMLAGGQSCITFTMN